MTDPPFQLDSDGKIVGGVYSGMTPDEVRKSRESYEAACEGGDRWWREIIEDVRKDRPPDAR